jgi:hypothetical protein
MGCDKPMRLVDDRGEVVDEMNIPKTRLFMVSDCLIAHWTLKDAKRLARLEGIPTKHAKAVTGEVGYCDMDGHLVGDVDAADCSAVWPEPCVVPDDY